MIELTDEYVDAELRKVDIPVTPITRQLFRLGHAYARQHTERCEERQREEEQWEEWLEEKMEGGRFLI